MTSRNRASLIRLLPLILLATVASACGGGDTSSGYATMGMMGIPSPTRVGANLVFADVSINGIPGGRLAIDTGSPLVIVDVAKFPGLMLANVTQPMANLTVGSLTIDGIPLLPMQIGSSMDPLNFAGLFGGNVMQQFAIRLDYAHPDLAFRIGTPPMEMATDGVETPGDAVSFSLQGGGAGRLGANGPVIIFKSTRIPLTVELEGAARSFILDTGASETTVKSTVYSAIRSDGRAEISGLPISTVMGPTTAHVTRVRTLKVGGASVANAAVMMIGDQITPTGDELLSNIETEVGHPVDGLLGGNFLREFMVTIDYPGGMLHLQRYTAAVIVDEFKRVGFELGPGSGAHRYSVGVVYQGTDAAAKQLSVGDEVVSVDGQELDTLDSITADGLLSGTVGQTHTIGVGNTRGLLAPNTTVGVLIEDLIPAP